MQTGMDSMKDASLGSLGLLSSRWSMMRRVLWSGCLVLLMSCGAGGSDPGAGGADLAAGDRIGGGVDTRGPGEDVTADLDVGGPGPEDVLGDAGLDSGPDPDMAGGDDVDAGIPACEPGEGCFLDPCSGNGDCLSGWCVEHLGEDVCTLSCVEECPAGFSCEKIAGTEPDVVYACVSLWPKLCLPCTENQGCKTGEDLGSLCTLQGEGGEAFCGAHCAASVDCPEGWTCGEVTSVDGLFSTQCIPAEEACGCTDKAVAEGLYTLCQVANEHGICEGFRQCGEEGLAPCDAPAPAVEVCNGVDDDCDGAVDEETCDDGNPCTEDSCDGADGCVYNPLAGVECTDGDLCTVGDHCVEGVCAGNPVQCDDGNECTDDLCVEGVCQATDNNTLCDDGDPCTLGDVCDGGLCKGTAIACDCLVDEDCVLLEDGDLCNGTLACDVAELPYQCEVDQATVVTCDLPDGADPFCQAAVCDPETGGCAVEDVNEGFACDDGDACTVGEKCVAGACTDGLVFPCDDGNACTVDTCDPLDGCEYLVVDGACDDGDPCTVGDNCSDGACVSGPPLDCEDGNPCTEDSCAPGVGCVHAIMPGNCDDGDACTVGETCINGACGGGDPLDCEDGNPCTTNTCSAPLACVSVLNNLPCDDDDLCTTGDLCQNGACLATGALNCTDGNPCTDDGCAPDAGCQFVPNDDDCTDGNLCTTGDHCVGGACVADGTLDCDDGNPCTDDLCAPAGGCQHPPNQDPCDDLDPCTTGDHCNLGTCVAQDYDCDDDLPCTEDVCDGEGGCFFPAAEGWCLIAGSCVAAGDVNPLAPCQGCVPGSSETAWSPLDGPPCEVVEHGEAACVAGACEIVSCDPGYDDCDLLLGTGCEVSLLSDDENCGACGEVCTLPEHCYDGDCSFQCPGDLANCDGECVDTASDPMNCTDCGLECTASGPEVTGVCDGGCGEEPCPEDHWNVNLSPEDGCEYVCALTEGGVEICDGFDNDCDEAVDEDFDLQSDPDNCGVCGEVCGPYPHVETVACAGGECAIEACQDGYLDLDGNVLTGCEELIATGEIWVDAWNFFDPDEDGTQAHPFDTLHEAVAVAEQGTLIHVLEGTYAAGVTVEDADVIIAGAGEDLVFLLGPEHGTGIEVLAENVVIRDLTVQGAATGVLWNGVPSGTLEDVSVVSIAGGTDQEAAAVKVLDGGGVTIQRVTIDGVTGGTGAIHGTSPSPGKIGAGLLVDGSSNVQLLDSQVRDVTGGTGGKTTYCCAYTSKAGAVGAGVYLRSGSTNNMILRVRIEDIEGGTGGKSTYGSNHGAGAIGAGVYQHTGSGLAVTSVVINDVRPGKTGGGADSAYSACIYGHSIGAALINMVTCVGSGVNRQRGIWADDSPQGLYGVSSTIITDMSGHCLYSHADNFASTLMASYSNLWSCAGGLTSNAQIASSTIQEDPLFVNPAEDDFHLQAGSPCIDTGKTSLDYCDEPAPNGCRVNMGGYGDTDEATPAPGAEHCDC